MPNVLTPSGHVLFVGTKEAQVYGTGVQNNTGVAFVKRIPRYWTLPLTVHLLTKKDHEKEKYWYIAFKDRL